MKYMSDMDLFRAHCKLSGLWGVCLGHVTGDEEFYGNLDVELAKAVPWLSAGSAVLKEFAIEKCGYFFFETEDEARRCFEATSYGGPTALNPYSGPVSVCAGLINSQGEFVAENY